ncbi:type II CRISPR-associated endonuclease Cas1 [Periweissella beninensis]|uniref:type II CRISPR-associated endonuclease Cas1 n=1 Tax=Periweissella beninensis TaxID=504936 RepID=UPI0021A6A459|nr:type II CRISPR-associated endonuclease Cas1 [Periweissella beninensis]MCT4396583.1 type II CRISPR-associated endonuclease Cas1 [Periweissella beninensis]
MGWRTLIITQHTKVAFQMGQVVIKTVDQIFQVPLSDLNLVIIETTQATITSYVIQKLIKNDVRVIICDQNYLPVGEMIGYYSNNQRIKHIEQQFKWSKNLKDILWQQIVTVKMKNQQQVLQRLELDSLALAPHIEKILIGDSSNREAIVARMYFTRLYGKDFVRKDDNNKINVHLNYGYQILLAAVAREIQAAGYLTELGIHHQSYENFLNLASDMMEPLRPLIDIRTWKLRNMGEMDFSIDAKLKLVDVLNMTVNFKSQEMLITSVISELLRDSLAFLNQDIEESRMDLLPKWEFKL